MDFQGYLGILLSSLFLVGCSFRALYPALGGGMGAGGGALLAGPGGAVVGGMGGAAAGSLIAGNQDVADVANAVKALSTGDVKALVDAGMAEQRGFLDKVIDGIYDLLTICGIAAALFFIVPLIYARLLHKKFKLFEGDARKETPPP